MAPTKKDSSRESHFPSIEKKYGEPMSHWFAIMKKLADKKYPEQVAHLKENYGFSQAHANALVMFTRGSKSSKRFASADEYFKKLPAEQAATAKKIFKVITTKYPKLELVIAWNQPMLKSGSAYVFGLCAVKNHILIASWSQTFLKEFGPRITDLTVNKKTIGVPNDWKIDEKLLKDMVKARLAEIKP